MMCKIFVIILFVLQVITQVFTQGIFSPATFTSSSCTGNSYWTIWFDSNNPNPTLGEFEVTNHLQQLFTAYMCPVPIAIEVIIFKF